jgi:hypothetical protein
MAENTGTADDTQAESSAAPQAGDPQAQAADAQQPQAGSATGEGTEPDAAALQRELTQARREAAGYRTKLKSYEDRDKSESEKSTERIAELERELAEARTSIRSNRLQAAAFSAARKLGFRNPDLAYRLVSVAEVEFDDAGQPKNIERLLDGIAKADPYLVNGTTDSGLGPRGSAAPSVDMNASIRRAAGRA